MRHYSKVFYAWQRSGSHKSARRILPIVFGAAAGVLVAALGIALVGGDIGVAVVVSGLFGLGGILALGPETPPRLSELLFGDLLGLDTQDLVVAALLTAGVLAALALGYRQLAAAGFERTTRRADLLLLAILGLTTVAAVQGLGNLLRSTGLPQPKIESFLSNPALSTGLRQRWAAANTEAERQQVRVDFIAMLKRLGAL